MLIAGEGGHGHGDAAWSFFAGPPPFPLGRWLARTCPTLLARRLLPSSPLSMRLLACLGSGSGRTSLRLRPGLRTSSSGILPMCVQPCLPPCAPSPPFLPEFRNAAALLALPESQQFQLLHHRVYITLDELVGRHKVGTREKVGTR